MGLRGIEREIAGGIIPPATLSRVTDIHHTTVMGWVKEAGLNLKDVPEVDEEPEITDLDELQTFVGNKRHKVWIWTAVNHKQAGILAWVIGDRSAGTFKGL